MEVTMYENYKITKEAIWAATENGKSVILHFYPQSSACFGNGGRLNFRIRPDDKNPSCAVFQNKEGIWMIQDKGGSDNQARTAIQLVMNECGLSFADALTWIANRFAPELLEGKTANVVAQPDMEAVAPQEAMSIQVREGGRFTDGELAMLGYQITQELCDEFGLKPVDSFTTASKPGRKDGKMTSWKLSANERYPMYFYDYGSRGKKEDSNQHWGKLYTPLGQTRFQYYGNKPENIIFGTLSFMDEFLMAKADPEYKMKTRKVNDDGEIEEAERKWDNLIICSGPSDALNVRNATAGNHEYQVCWLNSETADLTEYDFSIFQRLAKNIYILYDIDETGIANMYRIALRYLDIKIITLPSELTRFKDRKGKPCKDAKDFFVHFRRPENQNPKRLFQDLVKLAGSLKFWVEKRDQKTGKLTGYDINNEQLYAFLGASGYHRIASDSEKKGYTFCRIRDNVVTLIDEAAISAECSAYLLEYIKTHPKYYSQTLANTVHRSNQIRLSSLERLPMVKPNFKSWNETDDHLFFRNGIFKVSRNGISPVKPAECPCMIYSDKILPFDFSPMSKTTGEMPFFDIDYTDEYKELRSRLAAVTPASPEYSYLRKEIDTLEDSQRYRLTIRRKDFSFLQYIYNTGRTFWRKEELGIPLSREEQTEHNLNFISKVMSLGYLLAKHKASGQPYAVFCMETEQSDEGTHLGGTGKSLFASSVEYVRKQLFIDGQKLNPRNGDFMLQGVDRGITDSIFIDDLNHNVNLHDFMPMITGKMVVNPKYVAAFTIDFKDSPKVVFTSNHAIKGFDASLRRRTWFAAFTDYYHADDLQRGLKERSPYTEFGKNLIEDYTAEEMNQFYNFMLNCLAVWQKIHTRIQPPMKAIDKRLLQRALSDEFLYWAEEYFTDNRLNCLVDKNQTFEDYKESLPPKFAQMIKMKTFKQKLIQYCTYRDWKFNPDELKTTPSDKERNDIHRKVDGKDVYYFFIATGSAAESNPIPVPSIFGEAGAGENPYTDEDTPPL